MTVGNTTGVGKPPSGLVIGIQSDELLASMIERAVASITIPLKGEYEEIRLAARRNIGLPRDIARIIAPFAGLVPSLDETIAQHSGLRMVLPFSTASIGALLLQTLRGGPIPNVAQVRKISFNNRDYVWQLGVCPACAREELESTGCVTWKRQPSVKGYAICTRHHCRILRVCAGCGRSYNLSDYGWQPRPTCVYCGGSMQATGDQQTESLDLALAQDMDAISEGTLDGITAEDILPLLQEAAQEQGLVGNKCGHRLDELVQHWRLDRWAAQHFRLHSVKAILRPVMVGRKFGLSPMLNLAAVHVMLGPVGVVRKMVEARRKAAADAGATPVHFTAPEQSAARSLLVAILDAHPNLAPIEVQRAFAEAYGALMAFDAEWLMATLDNHKARGQDRRRHLADADYAAAVARRANELSLQWSAPQITRAVLLEGIISWGCFYRNLALYPRTEAALNRHMESKGAWRCRRLRLLAAAHPAAMDAHLLSLLPVLDTVTPKRIQYGLARLERNIEVLAQRTVPVKVRRASTSDRGPRHSHPRRSTK